MCLWSFQANSWGNNSTSASRVSHAGDSLVLHVAPFQLLAQPGLMNLWYSPQTTHIALLQVGWQSSEHRPCLQHCTINQHVPCWLQDGLLRYKAAVQGVMSALEQCSTPAPEQDLEC